MPLSFLCGAVAVSVLQIFPLTKLLVLVIRSENEISLFEFLHMYVYVHVGIFVCCVSVIYFSVEIWRRLKTLKSVDVAIEASRYYVGDQTPSDRG